MPTINETADRIVSQDVLCCMSHIISALARAAGGEIMQQHNGGTDAARELAEQASELTYPLLDHEEAARQMGWAPDHWGIWVHKDAPDQDGYDNPVSLCDEKRIEPYEREVYEHWAVSTWLGEKLAAKGEKVDFDFGNLCVWARTTTGQGIAQDHVIQEIARDLRAVA